MNPAAIRRMIYAPSFPDGRYCDLREVRPWYAPRILFCPLGRLWSQIIWPWIKN